MRLVRLVKVHYLVPQLARQDLDKCLQLMDHSLKVQIVVLDRRDQVKLVVLDLIFPQVHNKDLQAEHSRDLKLVVLDRQMMDPKDLPLQQVKVVHRLHRHSIHSLDSHRQLLQVTDPQVDRQALDQIMAPLPQQAQDQIMGADPQLVAQVLSDEASLTSRPRRLVVHRDLQQTTLMEVPLKHRRRYSVVSLPRLLHRLMVRRVETLQPQVRPHLMVQLR